MVAELPGLSFFSLDVAPDGRVYLPEHSRNVLLRFDPATSRVTDLGDFHGLCSNIHNVRTASDGWVYLIGYDYRAGGRASLIRCDPAAGTRDLVPDPCGASAAWPVLPRTLNKDADGRVLVAQSRWGRSHWLELKGGVPVEVDQGSVRLNAAGQPLAFRDGSHVTAVRGKTVSVADRDGGTASFEVAREDSPLRIFSVYGGGGRIWCGTFMPLTLFSLDPRTGERIDYGNPTETDGEIYSMVFSRGKLFFASYSGAYLHRLNPGLPVRRDATAGANPAPLGRMKEEGLPLQRPTGYACGEDGAVYFAAMGGYGCPDSGLCRIDPETEQVTRWIYPRTTFGSLAYLPGPRRLLVSEVRAGEDAIRFTFVDPASGRILDDGPVIADKGNVTSFLADGGDLVYGMHAYRATLFAYSVSERRIVRSIPEMGMGDNCSNCLLFGPDGRIWGLTATGVFAAERDLSRFEQIASYEDHAGLNANRFGFCMGPDGKAYFPNGTHLMRVGLRT